MSKKVAIVQSNYIPWKGYFDLINLVDEFVLFDTVQYTKRDWRNRNLIKTANGLQWLSIPVKTKGNYFQKIEETIITDEKWSKKHWASIKNNYSKSPYFRTYEGIFDDFYQNVKEQYLSKVNFALIKIINQILGINTKITWSSDYNHGDGKTERLLEICHQARAGTYVSGPSAKAYLDSKLIAEAGIDINWMNYDGYLEYSQLFPPFEHGVTILDLIFNMGAEGARKYMKSF